jgi:cbb3-type cytochrome oxidase maturation protein
MTILLVLVPLGVLLLCIAIGAFVWAVRNGQFEDLEGEGARILFEDDGETQRKATRESRDSGARP